MHTFNYLFKNITLGIWVLLHLHISCNHFHNDFPITSATCRVRKDRFHFQISYLRYSAFLNSWEMPSLRTWVKVTGFSFVL